LRYIVPSPKRVEKAGNRMADFRPEEWTQDDDLIWCGYLNKDMTHAMLAQFWSNDEATDVEAASYILRACRSYRSMLALLEKALPIIDREAYARDDALQQSGLNSEDSVYWTEMRALADEISAEIDRAKGRGCLMAEIIDLIDLLKVPGVRVDGGNTWLLRVGERWNVYQKKRRRVSGGLVISTPDINEAIAAFVRAAGIRKEDVRG